MKTQDRRGTPKLSIGVRHRVFRRSPGEKTGFCPFQGSCGRRRLRPCTPSEPPAHSPNTLDSYISSLAPAKTQNSNSECEYLLSLGCANLVFTNFLVEFSAAVLFMQNECRGRRGLGLPELGSGLPPSSGSDLPKAI